MTDVHCKPYNHTRVGVGVEPPRGIPTATFMPEMPCHEPKIGKQPGVVLAMHADTPFEGMHLLPDAVAQLPTDLRDAAREATGVETVSLSHPFNTVYRVWGAWTPQYAMAVADRIEQAWQIGGLSLDEAVAHQHFTEGAH